MHFALDSYNRPYLCQHPTWKENATTLAMVNSSTIPSPHGIFINDKDRIHVADHVNGTIVVWHKNNPSDARILHVHVFNYSDLFVSLNGDVYFENGNETGRIDKWSVDQNSTTFVAKFSEHCYGLFLDFKNSLYCSQHDQHRVTKISLNSKNRTEINVAGNGSHGHGQNQLNNPWGIFVDRNFKLFVADTNNHRIQRFQAENPTEKTLAEKGFPSGLNLSSPTDVTLARHDNLYITDNKNNRIVRSNGTHSECVAGCTEVGGSNANQLNNAYAIQFNSQGDLYVADENNDRIQVFELNPGCGKIVGRIR